jgi:hypothetical protein
MASVSSPTPAGRYHEGRANRILSIAKVETLMVRYADPDGKESIVQVQAFGEADYGKGGKPEERMLGIWIVANLKQLQDNLKMAPMEQAKDIIAAMESKGLVREGKLMGGTVTAVELPDVSAVFENLEEEKPAAE